MKCVVFSVSDMSADGPWTGSIRAGSASRQFTVLEANGGSSYENFNSNAVM